MAACNLVLWNDYYRDFNEESAKYGPELFLNRSLGAPVAGMVYDYAFHGRPHFIQFPNY